MKYSLLVLLAILSVSVVSGQGTVYGVKGGLTVGFQKWNTFERDPLLKYHGIVSIESKPNPGEFAVFAQAGYHQKGSALRNTNFFNPQNNTFFRAPTYEFIFNNVSLTAGIKQQLPFLGESTKAYYLLGIRGDYTVSTNLDEFEDLNVNIYGAPIFPLNSDEYIREINYGLTGGAGLEFPFGEFVSGLLEVTINPDFSNQYYQPQIDNIIVRNPYNGSNLTSLPERRIRNLTFEVTLGFRFLHKVEYID